MSRPFFITGVATTCFVVATSSLLAIDQIGHERLAGIPTPRVTVDLDFDSQSEAAFLRPRHGKGSARAALRRARPRPWAPRQWRGPAAPHSSLIASRFVF